MKNLTVKELFYLLGVFHVCDGLWQILTHPAPVTPRQTIEVGIILLLLSGSMALGATWGRRLLTTLAGRRRRQATCKVLLVLIVSLCLPVSAHAGGLGIPMDSFLTQFVTFVVGLGLVLGLVGLTGYVGGLFDNPFSHVLQGSISFFTKAGLLGGGTVILAALGLTAGGLL